MSNKPKLLLHICCAPCSAGVFDQLTTDFEVTAFFYNPNIYPIEELQRRKEESINFCSEYKIPLVIQDEIKQNYWLEKVRGWENEPEGGKRCLICYTIRLEKTAEFAKKNKYDYFATTLTISPYKNAYKINSIGLEIEKNYKVKFYQADFKKKDGFKKSLEISQKHKLYRQNYCGCQFSIRKPKK